MQATATGAATALLPTDLPTVEGQCRACGSVPSPRVSPRSPQKSAAREARDTGLIGRILCTLTILLMLALVIQFTTTPDAKASSNTSPVHRAGASTQRAAYAAPARWQWDHLAHRTWIVRFVFGRYGDQAVRVARCESGIRPWAHNGQFLGVFQMGSMERARYGHGAGTWAQAFAARRYFIASGRDWSPWACRP